MEIREIRIGNRIEYLTVQNPDRWEEIVVSPVTFGRLSVEPLRFRPIELTPEWLKRVDWKGYKYLYFHSYFCLDGQGHLYYHGDYTGINVNYVHTFQNLYYALKGEELAIDKQISNGN